MARITGAYGLWQAPRTPLSAMVDDVCHRRPHRRSDGADQPFEFTYVKDIAAGLIALLGALRLRHPLYHLASGRMDPLSAVADAVRAVRPAAEIDLGPGAPADAWVRSPLKVSRLTGDLGFTCRWSLPAGIPDYLDAVESGGYGAEVLDGPPGER